jgi:DNA repair protein RadA/Sms
MPLAYGDGNWIASDVKSAKVEHGLPEGFLSLWGGSPGVGKTRTAISLSKSLNRLGHKVLYFNGEADQMDFRMWLGSDVDNSLFRVVSGELIRTEDSVAKIYREKPKVVIFDSFQMLSEVAKGNRGAKSALSRFKVLKSDHEAGRPHIIFISQLNKKGELAGSRYIEHMVDFSATVTKLEGRKGCFIFECPRKNRGGETPRHAIFKHGETGIDCLSTEFLQTPVHKLLQLGGPAVAAGVVDKPSEPAPVPAL